MADKWKGTGEYQPVPIPNNCYGGPEEEGNRVFRKREGVRPGTKIGIPGRSDGFPKLKKDK